MAAAAAATIPIPTTTAATDFAHEISSLHLETHSNIRCVKKMIMIEKSKTT
jgi:hypothetical protein